MNARPTSRVRWFLVFWLFVLSAVAYLDQVNLSIAGKPLWHFNAGQNIAASAMSYAANTKQYVAIAAGSDVFSFELP